MKASLIRTLTVFGLLAAPLFAQSFSTRAAASSDAGVAASTPQAGASASTGATAQDASISHKGKEEDKNSAATTATSSSNSGSVAGEHSPANQATGTPIQAELTKSINAKKAKQGDEVVAKTTEDFKSSGSLNIPKNSKLIGHVTAVQPYEKGKSESRLSILFDKALTKGGQEIPIHASIQALAAPAQLSIPPDMSEPSGAGSSGAPGGDPGSGGGLVGGAAQTAGSAASGIGNAAGSAASNPGSAANSTVGSLGRASASGSGNARLASDSRGVIGLNDLRLGAGTEQGAVISSASGNVRLDSGTRILLQISAQ